MAFVVYNTNTKRMVRSFKTERGAKVSLAAYNRRGFANLAVMNAAEFDEQFNRWTTTINLLSGEEVRIRQQDVGTCCDPSTETYWSM
jgi:hypothetical protein